MKNLGVDKARYMYPTYIAFVFYFNDYIILGTNMDNQMAAMIFKLVILRFCKNLIVYKTVFENIVNKLKIVAQTPGQFTF
jgi:hypothetical protein